MSLTRKRKFWIIGITIVSTTLLLVFLQNFKTPEKVMEQKVEHRYTTSDPQFRREMSVLLGPAIVPGNHVTALQNGDEIFPAMLLAIHEAQTSINFETFIYWTGEIGDEFTQALSERGMQGYQSMSSSTGWAASGWNRPCWTPCRMRV
jgi:cardiolipin synthase A/B